ncbi:glycosyltransferase family 2 protein [Halomonas stenophila]|uniref:dTDP-4-dehydrorhamnose reductase n=1 Tax=Halomonas stenophila TaxID=795312 RepID=A0A7W5ER59_9GAMM|nr:glycosyltransferase family 2 protein [Halomonas stenophila]MBB3229537.1 dTDP-4-dehydrorhamnose reductase [Halomonas stenophila]
MMDKVIAVVLTYNRKELLQRCLEAIQAQTRPCDDIIVINNASTDGTLEMLNDGSFSDIKIYTLKENKGAAGGFNLGFRVAYDNGADHVWMMDDDVIPEPTALEALLEADALLEEKRTPRSYLVSMAYSEAGRLTNLPYLSEWHKNHWPQYLEHGLVAVGYSTFVSILVPRRILETYGLPIAEMFIWGEDAEFTLRITREAPGYLVGDSKVAHVRAGTGGISILPETNPARIAYYSHFIRNNIFLARKYKTRRRLGSVLCSNLMLVLKLLLRKEPGKARVVLKGMRQSLYFSPRAESVHADYDDSCIELTITAPHEGRSATPSHDNDDRKLVLVSHSSSS